MDIEEHRKVKGHAGVYAPRATKPDIHRVQTLIANVYFVTLPNNDDWFLVDTGVANSEDKIISYAEEQYGADRPPVAILLTHGHFDHVGSVKPLVETWHVPVYAHKLELPYLTGKVDYPPADPTVGGGLMSRLAPLYPNEAIDLGEDVHPLPPDGRLPFTAEWHWIHTPGHTPGHVSFFRNMDRALIAGDAFITVKQESAFSVMTQAQEVHGPPQYFTTDWDDAWRSVKKLRLLEPSAAFTGHGIPMSGEDLAKGLDRIANDFDRLAIPEHGKYVH